MGRQWAGMGAWAALAWLALLWVHARADPFQVAKPSFSIGFTQNFQKFWSPNQIQESDATGSVQISLTQSGGAGFGSYKSYLFGKFEAKIKTVPGNSAGTCFSFYLTSSGQLHDEIDFEFLGNVSGQPVILQTNLYAAGIGGREVRHFLWFDPSTSFHTYTILWNHYQIVWLVDNIPVRVFPNANRLGVAYPNSNPMTITSSIYDADDWATNGGAVKIDWHSAPFTGSFRSIVPSGCEWTGSLPYCAQQSSNSWWDDPLYRSLTDAQVGQLHWVKKHYGVYDYCDDRGRYPQLSPECTLAP